MDGILFVFELWSCSCCYSHLALELLHPLHSYSDVGSILGFAQSGTRSVAIVFGALVHCGLYEFTLDSRFLFLLFLASGLEVDTQREIPLLITVGLHWTQCPRCLGALDQSASCCELFVRVSGRVLYHLLGPQTVLPVSLGSFR